MEHRAELKKAYKETHKPMGVYQIRNDVNGKVFVGVSLNLPGILNRHRFELNMGNHQNKVLQTEWREFGESHFTFDILDELKPRNEEVPHNYREELAVLEALWLDKLQPYDDRGYNGKGK